MLANKTCIVTGSTAGIGKGIARMFLKQGAFVFINGRSEETVARTIAGFSAEGLMNTHGVVSDISTQEGCEKFFQDVENTGRVVDILVNNMGIFDTHNFFDVTDEQWSNYWNVNVQSTVRMCKQYLKGMLDRNQGRIIIVSSEAGMRPIPDMIPYW